MAELTGAALVINFKGTDIGAAANYREWKDSIEMGLVDASAGADAARTYLTTLMESSGEYKGLYQAGTAATDEFILLTPGANGTLIIGPKGTAAGNPKLTISNAIVKKTDREFKYDDVVKISSELQFNAAPSYSTY